MSEETGTGTAPKAPQRKHHARRPDFNLDLKNRDPYDLNAHVRPIMRNSSPVTVHPELFTNFEEIIGEPEGSHSDECIWVNSYKGFQAGKRCCYGCLTYMCSIPLAFCWGCNFACITFMHIWSITPLFRVFRINCDCASKFFSTFVHCWCDPCYEAMALMFTKIYINIVSASPGFKEKTYAGPSELVVDRQVPDPYIVKGARAYFDQLDSDQV